MKAHFLLFTAAAGLLLAATQNVLREVNTKGATTECAVCK